MIKKKHMESVTIKKIHSEEIRIKGLELSLRVFTECNTSDYNDEGYNYFCSFIENKEQISQLLMYGAFYNNSLIGIAGFKENGTHLSLFFREKLNLKCKTTKNNIISSYKEDYFFDRKIREDRVLDDLDRLFQN